MLLMAGAGKQGYVEWQAANMTNRMNKVINDIFTLTLECVCGLSQGNGFLVEIANLYAWLLITWWNMDPLNAQGSMEEDKSPRQTFPLTADEVCQLIPSPV